QRMQTSPGFQGPVADSVRAQLTALRARLSETEIHELFGSIPQREQEVLSWRFGLGRIGPLTLQEIGQQLGVSRERVRQLENKAIKKLCHPTRLYEFFAPAAWISGANEPPMPTRGLRS